MKISLALIIALLSVRLSAQINLVKPFNDCGLKGSITIFDYNAKMWISSDIYDSEYATLPASTFKIINTLIALETGVIEDANEIIGWTGSTDTVKYGYRPDIYHDMSVKDAFKQSAVWVYTELAKRVGKEVYKKFLTECHYGNADVSIDDPDFWNYGNLAVSPENQVKILIGVYEESLPFSHTSFKIVKEMMIEEQTENYILRAKTGWTKSGRVDTGWWVGYVERKDNVYFFATRLIKDVKIYNPDFGNCRKKITKTILKQLRIID